MLENIIVLVVIVIAGYAIVKEEKNDYHEWLSNYSRLKEDLNEALIFWKHVLNSRIRRWTIAVILVLQSRGAISMIISIIILFGASYMLSRYQIVDMIDWTDKRTQVIATAICGTYAFFLLVRTLGTIGIIVAVLIVIVARNKRFNFS